ncbi:hypothetical protein [Aquimarina sp. RZ0]|uniref:hypothetical protein n=1 Tax=Aquimarina sp. RZ0 TaxID=2607730 RepID=UPI0011F2E246|nr:hypothetical protein [Aquimarina sp. RZ0]KAA1244198.1 hypothetical protein F0000_17710 [Aquimarina sp. RZ0]
MTFISCLGISQKPAQATSIIAIDEYHGQKIEDPYRTLENLEDSTVIDWLQEQGKYAFNLSQKIFTFFYLQLRIYFIVFAMRNHLYFALFIVVKLEYIK